MPDLIRSVAARAVAPDMFLLGMGLLYATGLILLAAAAIKFLEHGQHPQPLATKHTHFFSTREMLIAVLALFPFWLNSFGQLPLEVSYQTLYFGLGAAVLCLATIWHVWAKFDIRRMWSDAIEIKEAHEIRTTGAYALARHPMYASLLLWCWAASLALFNGATLVITTVVVLPLMIKRAKDEEAALLKSQPDYFLYQQNTPMLAPFLAGRWGLAARIAAATLYGYSAVVGLTGSSLLLLCAVHIYLSYCIAPAKVAFSYRSKTAMTVMIWGFSQIWPPVHYLLYVLLAMFLYGLRFDCPCMWLYEKYHGCPCLSWVRRAAHRPPGSCRS